MSFAILGANAALVPTRVRVAKSVNNTRVSTVTVAVRPDFPALDATLTSIPIPSRVACSISRSTRVRAARAARDARLDGGPRALFLDRPENRRGADDDSAFSRKSDPSRVVVNELPEPTRRRNTTDPTPRTRANLQNL